MPIPAEPADEKPSTLIVTLFQQLHDQLREEIAGLGDDELNWSPITGANTIATILTHLIGSEAETVRVAAGLPAERDRASEFGGHRMSAAAVAGLLDQADELLDAAAPRLEERLSTVVGLPTLPDTELRSGITWLIGNYGHAREHVGHVQLTRDLNRRDAIQAP